MKSIFKVVLGVAALSLTQQASAANFRITGATSFRGAVHDTIVALMGGNPTANVATCKIATSVAAPTTLNAATARTAVNGANVVTFVGDLSSIGITGISTVQCSWSGSASGLVAINTGASLNYVSTAAASAATAGYDTTAFGASGTGDSGAALFAFSDVFQNAVTSTPVSGLTNTNVAIVPFIWVANRTSTLTGITSQQSRALFATGMQRRSLFTGNASDTSYVFATGRDGGSGTRITALAETKYGIANNVQQFFATTSGAIGAGSVTVLKLWPTTGSGADALSPGNGGYTSGSNIRDLMGYSTNTNTLTIQDQDGNVMLDPFDFVTPLENINGEVVSYLGAGDAATATGTTNNGKRLAYDGVQYTGDAASMERVYNGAYTFWCYQHLNHKGALTAGSDDLKLNNGLRNNITPLLGANGLDLSLMQVQRASDGAVVGP